MKLTSNNTINTLPENEQVALLQILLFMAKIEDGTAYLAAVNHARTLLQANHPHIQQLLRRGPSLIRFIVDLRSHDSFSELEIKPKELSEFNLYPWGLLEPVLRGCLLELTFLSTDLDLSNDICDSNIEELQSPETQTLIAKNLRNTIKTHSLVDSPICEEVFDLLVHVSEKAFTKLDMGGCDLGSNAKDYHYDDKMGSYYAEVISEVTSQVNSLMSSPDDMKTFGSYGVRVASILVRKITILLGGSYFGDARLRPSLPGPLPLLCPSMFSSIQRSWLKLAPTLSTVRISSCCLYRPRTDSVSDRECLRSG
jgi:hypothetical protein